MRLLLLSLLVSVVYCGVDPDAKTKAGSQEATASKANDGVNINSQHSGSKSGTYSGSATKDNKVQGSSGHKAGVISPDNIYAGTDTFEREHTVIRSGMMFTADDDAAVDWSNTTKDGPQRAIVKTASGKGLETEVKNEKNKFVLTAKSIQNSKDTWNIDIEDKKTAKVYKKGQLYATVNNLDTKDKITIDTTDGKLKGKAGSKKAGALVENTFTEEGKPLGTHKATLHETGSYTAIRSGLTKTTADVDETGKKVLLTGSLIGGSKATAEYEDAKEADCPYDAYYERRRAGQQNKPWKYREPDFKIHWQEVTVTGETDQTGNSIKASWPQCIDVNIPITFPKGTKLENLALGLAIYFPGCPRFTCAGRVCGLEFAAQAGAKVGEACFTDNICELPPVAPNKKNIDIIGFAAGNAESNVCKQGYTGGTKLVVKNTFCPNPEDRSGKYSACPLLNFAADESALNKKIVVITRLYEKKACRGLACLLNIKSLGLCSTSLYNLEGCREVGMDYKITAFGFLGDDLKYTGINRRSGARKGKAKSSPPTSFWRTDKTQ